MAEGMKPPIAILFANLKGNVGDFAILHSMLLELTRSFPGQALDVFSHGFYEIDQDRFSAFRELSNIDFALAGTTYFSKPPPKLFEHTLRSFGLWPRAQAWLIDSLTQRVAHHASAFAKYGAIFLAGGEHWGGTRGGISMFGTLSAVHLHNDRIYAFPFSVNPRVHNFNLKASLQHNLGKVRSPLVARDGMSKTVLDGLGIPSVLGVDCVFSMRDLAARISPMQGRDPSRILLAVTGSRRSLERDLRAALHRIGSGGPAVGLMTTCEFEDGEPYQTVAREIGIPYYAPTTWQEAVAEIKASSLLVTNRLHGLILGTLANTPLLPVTNRKKSEAFAKDAEMPCTAAGLHELSTRHLERCLAERSVIMERMGAYLRYTSGAVRGPLVEL